MLQNRFLRGLAPAIALLSTVCAMRADRVRAGEGRVEVPVHLDYPLVQELLARELFTGPGTSREVLNDPTACSEVTVREPRVAPRGDALEVVAAVDAKLGVGVAGSCTALLAWQGSVGLLGRPEVEPGGTQVRLEPQRVWLLDTEGRENPDPRLGQLTDSSLRALLGRFRLDLAPTIQSLGALLPEVLPRHTVEEVQAVVGSLHLDRIAVTPETLDVLVAFAVEPLAAGRPERALSPEELAQWEERWQMMDALLVMAVKHYAASTHLQSLRGALLDVLIESRYRLRDALAEPVTTDRDAVREWFLDSWQQLAPVVRSIALEQPGQEHLAFFTVITATDALDALDRLGPHFGLDISVPGLRRLARLINAGAADELLEFSEEVDPELKRLMDERFGAEEDPPPAAWRLDLSPFPRAVAAPADRLNSWVPAREELPDYLPMVADLLDRTATRALEKHRLDAQQQQVFRKMVLATAWQESCWRQYVVKQDKLVPLRSSSGDVGLMQVNERVWRGFYDMQQLRWDIGYNGASGTEVLLDYLVKYAIRKGEHRQPGGLANLARASYSAYNGGPSQISRYRRSNVSAYEKKVDTAFWDKYRQVDAGNELGVSACLGGELAGRARSTAATPAPGNAATPARAAAQGWLATQDPSHFTLQLGAFSQRELADKFLRQVPQGAGGHVQPHTRGGEVLYVVLYGSYPSRGAAESAARSLQTYKPWIRRIGDLR